MRVPVVEATIERRILVNYRVDLDVLASLLPPPFRPASVRGVGIAGICLIRLGDIRFSGLPSAVGLTAENGAHRVAVEWDGPGGPIRGVYIPRRDTSSRLVAILGGRVFPGWHHLADFDVDEGDGSYRVGLKSRDSKVSVRVSARRADQPMAGSVFETVEDASSFFCTGPRVMPSRPTPVCSTVWSSRLAAGASSPWFSTRFTAASSRTAPGSQSGLHTSTVPS